MKPILILLLVSSAGLFSCKKECDTRVPACKDVPPTNEMCQAAFSRWFYDQQTNTCELKNYSGCSQKGFATKGECEGCIRSRE